jgi:hypothetical protein
MMGMDDIILDRIVFGGVKELPAPDLPKNISDINHPLWTIYGFSLDRPERSDMVNHLRSML